MSSCWPMKVNNEASANRTPVTINVYSNTVLAM